MFPEAGKPPAPGNPFAGHPHLETPFPCAGDGVTAPANRLKIKKNLTALKSSK
jgi:hypothetical protein